MTRPTSHAGLVSTVLALCGLLSSCGAAVLVTPSTTTPSGPSITASPTAAVTSHDDVANSAPTEAELEIVAATRVFFGHQSVGYNILEGIQAIYDANHVMPPEFVESREARPGQVALFEHAPIGTNGDPMGKIADFRSVLDSGVGDEVQVALMKLCYVDFNAGTDVEAVFNSYRRTMDALAQAYPRVTFLYTTAPLTTEDSWSAVERSLVGSLTGGAEVTSENVARERYNALVRRQYGGTGRLLDIAAIEATVGDGQVAAGNLGGQLYYVLYPELTTDGGHLNSEGASLVGAELVRLIADARS